LDNNNITYINVAINLVLLANLLPKPIAITFVGVSLEGNNSRNIVVMICFNVFLQFSGLIGRGFQ